MSIVQNNEFEILLTLLRAGLWEKEVDDMSLFPLSAEQWRRIYALSCEQTVSGIIYRGIAHLPDNYMPPMDEMVKWMARIDGIERRNAHITKVFLSLNGVVEGDGLHPVQQKGLSVARMYDNPGLREPGDIDLWFCPEEWGKAVRLAHKLTDKVESRADGSLFYRWQGVEIEHHRAMFDLHNPFKKTTLQKLFANTETISQNSIRAGIDNPSPLADVVLQNTHILKHCIGLGIGLRQLCDLARTYFTYIPSGQIDGRDLQDVYDKLGLKKWSNMLHTVLVKCIGLESKYLPYAIETECSIDRLMEIVKRGGNFGLHSATRINVGNNTWKRKLYTIYSFLRGVRFSLNYAPMEVVGRVWSLTMGQFIR